MQRVLGVGVRRVSLSGELERLRAEVRYYEDRVALLRAKLYRRGQGSNARLQELERKLERAQQRLQDERSRTKA
jgi:hypothetical protein